MLVINGVIAVEKAQLKRLKRLNRSELLEIMLALKRENDILMMDNIRLKTLKHKLENEIKEITNALERIERGTYETDFPNEIARDGAQQEYNTFENASIEGNDMLSLKSVLDSFDDKVTNK